MKSFMHINTGNLILDEMLKNRNKNKKELYSSILKRYPKIDSARLWIQINSVVSFLNKYTQYHWDKEIFHLALNKETRIESGGGDDNVKNISKR